MPWLRSGAPAPSCHLCAYACACADETLKTGHLSANEAFLVPLQGRQKIPGKVLVVDLQVETLWRQQELIVFRGRHLPL